MTDKRLFTVAEAATYLSVSPSWVRARYRDGTIHVVYLSDGPKSGVRIDRRDLDRLIEERTS